MVRSMLLVAQGPSPGDTWRHELPADAPVTLGRDARDWFAPWEPFLARRHAELTVHGAKLRVRRLPGAVNPIFHAGRAADAFELAVGGSFVIGRTSFTLADAHTTTAHHPERPLLEMRTIGHRELDGLAFRDAPHRLDVLSRLPDVIFSKPVRAPKKMSKEPLRCASPRVPEEPAVQKREPNARRVAKFKRVDRERSAAKCGGDCESHRASRQPG